MLSLIVTACLLSDPAVCQDRKVPEFETHEALQCLLQAEKKMQAWREENPTWRIVRWQCKLA